MKKIVKSISIIGISISSLHSAEKVEKKDLDKIRPNMAPIVRDYQEGNGFFPSIDTNHAFKVYQRTHQRIQKNYPEEASNLYDTEFNKSAEEIDIENKKFGARIAKSAKNVINGAKAVVPYAAGYGVAKAEQKICPCCNIL